MNILVTNDDGYDALGINILFSKLLSTGHNVYMLAPSENRSAISNGITMTSPLMLKKIGENIWSYSGTPADCVITGIQSSLVKDKIDIVLSGINYGGNIGTDIIYSGTCAAARQGSLYGIPSVAISIQFNNECSDIDDCYNRMASFVECNLENFILSLKKIDCSGFFNVNAFSFPSWKGVRNSTVLSTRHYDDTVDFIHVNSSEMKSNFYGKEPVSSVEMNSDFLACKEGFISVSCVRVEPNVVKGIDGICFSI